MSLALTILTLVHVVISLVGIASGFVVLFGLLVGKRLDVRAELDVLWCPLEGRGRKLDFQRDHSFFRRLTGNRFGGEQQIQCDCEKK